MMELDMTVHVKEEVGEDETDSGLVIRCDNEDSSDREDAAQHLLHFVNIQPKLPILKPKVRVKSPSSMRSIDISVAPIAPGSTGLFPAIEAWPGEFDFKLIIAEDMTKSSKKYHFNPHLNKLYADMGAVINFQLHVTGSLPPGTVARSTLVYKSHNDRSKPVLRCPNHSSPNDPSNMGEAEWTLPHVLRCLNDFNSGVGVQYNINTESRRLSVVAGMDGVIPGREYFTKLYKFVCLGSCVGGIARRPLMMVVTLEECSGDVIGRQTVEVRLCTCPLRDHNQDQAKLVDKETGKVALKKSSSKEKEISQFANFDQTNQMSTNMIVQLPSDSNDGTVRLMSQFQDRQDSNINRALEVDRVGEATNKFREENPSVDSSQIYWVPMHSLENFKAVNKFAEYLDMTSTSNRGQEFKNMRTSLTEAVNKLAASREPLVTNGSGVTPILRPKSNPVKLGSACLAPRIQEYSRSVLKPTALPMRFKAPNIAVTNLQNVTNSAAIPKANTSVQPSSSSSFGLNPLENEQDNNLDTTIEFKQTPVRTEQSSITVLGRRSEQAKVSKSVIVGADDIKVEVDEPVQSTSSGKRSWFLENASAIAANSKRTKTSDGDMVIVHNNAGHVETANENPLEKSETTSPDSIRILESKKRVEANHMLKVESGEGSDSNNGDLEIKQPGAGPTFLTYRDNTTVQNQALDGSDSEDSQDRIIRI